MQRENVQCDPGIVRNDASTPGSVTSGPKMLLCFFEVEIQPTTTILRNSSYEWLRKRGQVILSRGNMGCGKPKEEGDDYELGQLV
jgi:hypothetical protein